MSVPHPTPQALYPICCVLAAVAVWDVTKRRIPNAFVAAVALSGLAHAFIAGGVRGLGASALGVLAGVALLYFQFSRGLMGAGDVKLLGAIGAWTGAKGALEVMVVGSLLGGVLAVGAFFAASKAEQREVRANLLRAAAEKELPVPATPEQMPRSRGIPFGVALALTAAAILVLRIAP